METKCNCYCLGDLEEMCSLPMIVGSKGRNLYQWGFIYLWEGLYLGAGTRGMCSATPWYSAGPGREIAVRYLL